MSHFLSALVSKARLNRSGMYDIGFQRVLLDSLLRVLSGFIRLPQTIFFTSLALTLWTGYKAYVGSVDFFSLSIFLMFVARGMPLHVHH